MSYSLLSTKRKFHRLLDSLSNGGTSGESRGGSRAPGNTSQDASRLDEAPSTDRRATKRLKPTVRQRSQIVAANPKLSLLLNQQQSTFSKPQSSLIRSNMSAGGTVQEAVPGRTTRLPPATWNPSDKRAFMDRVASFPGLDWRPKAEDINAVAFAKWGWKRVGQETVGCVSCRKRFVVVAPPVEESEEVEADVEDAEDVEVAEVVGSGTFVERTKARLFEEHDEECMWRHVHCDDSIWSVTLYPASRSIEALRERYLANMKHATALPETLKMPEQLHHNNNHDNLEALWRAFAGIYPSDTAVDNDVPTIPQASPLDVRLRAFVMALFGWGGIPAARGERSDQGMLQCTVCHSRIGLWMFRSMNGKEPVYDYLDIAEYHEMNCPWAFAESQHGGLVLDEGVEPKAAWDILRGLVFGHAATVSRQRPGTAPSASPDSDASRPVVNGTEQGNEQRSQTQPEREHLAADGTSVASKLTDEERRRRVKLNLSWLKKMRIGKKGDDRNKGAVAGGNGAAMTS